jgi:glycosyltransferase involved in cell wall biosynthesis
MKLKVLYLSPVAYFKGGAERSLFDLLGNPNVEPIVIAPEEGPILERAKKMGLKTYVLDFGRINSIRRPFSFIKGLGALIDLWSAAKMLKNIAYSENIQIMHSNGLKAHFINCLSSFFDNSLKSVVHIRDIPYTRTEFLVWKIIYQLCDVMILVSRACWTGQVLPAKCSIVHNGTALYPHVKSVLENIPPLSLGFVGRIHPAKGLHLLIQWLSVARKEGIDVRLSVRGSFSEDAPLYEAEIKAQIATLGGVVEFAGFIDSAEDLYKGIDIVVVPSEIPDPLPRSVMEAMARGIPVIGYPAGGIFEMVEDGRTGFLVKNSAEFTTVIRNILTSPDQLKLITEQARRRIEDEFSIDLLHQKVFRIYESILPTSNVKAQSYHSQ